MQQYNSYKEYRHHTSVFLERIDELFKKNIPIEQMRFFFEQQKKTIRAHEIIDFIQPMRSLIGYVDLGVSIDEIKDFIIQNAKDIPTDEIWGVILQEERGITFDPRTGYDDQWKIRSSRIDAAFFILLALEGQSRLSNVILERIKNQTIGNHVALTLFSCFTNDFHTIGVPKILYEDIVKVDWDFLYQLLRYTIENIPTFEWDRMKDAHDRLLDSFVEIYAAVLYGFSEKDFESFLGCIEQIPDKKWRSLVGMSRSEAISIVKREYKFNYRRYAYSMDDYDKVLELEDQNRQLFINLLTILVESKYRRTKKEEIDKFLDKNPTSEYWQVRKMLGDSDYEGQNVCDFIKKHLNRFSYDYLLKRILNVAVSEKINFAIHIAAQLKGYDVLLADIQKGFNGGEIDLSALKFLIYDYAWLPSDLGVPVDKNFYNALKDIVDRSKKNK